MRKRTLRRAVELFEKAGLAGEVGRTLVGQMDNLMYLSRYTEALARRANAPAMRWRKPRTFSISPDSKSRSEISTTDLNRYSESLAHYDRAQKALENTDDCRRHRIDRFESRIRADGNESLRRSGADLRSHQSSTANGMV